MELKLNVYNKKEIEKTYITETYDLMFGTIEDLLEVIDLDKVDDNVEVGKMILKVLPKIKPFLKDVFDGLTDDELKRTKVKELIPLFIDIFKFALDELGSIGDDSKN